MQYFTKYTGDVKLVLSYFDAISRTLTEQTENDDGKYIAKLREMKQQLENEKFEVIVIGEFGNGKSTFINALLGNAVLPMAITPSTAFINKIYYAEEPYYKLHMHDLHTTANKKSNKQAQTRLISNEEFHQLVAVETRMKKKKIWNEKDKKNVQNQLEQEEFEIQHIEHAEIGYPVELCKHNVILIDSPGTNDLDPRREQLTHHYIPKSEAAIIVLNAKRPLSNSELSLLRDRILSNDIGKVFVVLNMYDLLQEAERESVVRYVKDELSAFIPSVRVYPMASKSALNIRTGVADIKKPNSELTLRERRQLRGKSMTLEETGIIQFEHDMMQFLENERGNIKLQKSIQQGIQFIQDVITKEIQFERTLIHENVKIVEADIASIRKRMEGFSFEMDKTLLEIRQSLSSYAYELYAWYVQELKKINNLAEKTVNKHYYKGCNVDSVLQTVEERIAPVETALGEKLQEKVEQDLRAIVTKHSERFSNEIEATVNQIKNIVQNITSKSGSFNSLFDLMQNVSNQNIFERIIVTSVMNGGFFGFVGGVVGVSGYLLYKGIKKITSLIGAGLDFLFGRSRDRVLEELEKEISERFQKPIQKKAKQLSDKWLGNLDTVMDLIQNELENITNEQISQLEKMIEIGSINKEETQEKIDKLNWKEAQLNEIKYKLASKLQEIEGAQYAISRV